MTNLTTFGATQRAGFAGAEWREVVMMQVSLLVIVGQVVDELGITIDFVVLSSEI